LVVKSGPVIDPHQGEIDRAGLHYGATTALASALTSARSVALSRSMGSAMPEDRRRFVRIRPSGLVPKNATIIIGANCPTIRCTVIDISAGGACLEVMNAERLPQRFGLLHGRVRKRCVVVWRTQNRVGVQF
jgi:PilZ domain